MQRRGKKALILDPSISGPLSLLDVGLTELFAEHGVVKLLHLERKPLDDVSYSHGEPKLLDLKSFVYVARATLENAQLVASQIKSHIGSHPGASYSVFFSPRLTITCEKVQPRLYSDGLPVYFTAAGRRPAV